MRNSGDSGGGISKEEVEVAKLVLQGPVVVSRLPVVELAHERNGLRSWRPLTIPAAQQLPVSIEEPTTSSDASQLLNTDPRVQRGL